MAEIKHILQNKLHLPCNSGVSLSTQQTKVANPEQLILRSFLQNGELILLFLSFKHLNIFNLNKVANLWEYRGHVSIEISEVQTSAIMG